MTPFWDIDISKKVFLDCSLENGAIVAAPSHKEYYPQEAKDYFFVWPRDGAFVCLAAKALGLKQIQEPFFSWCQQAEGWKETGLFFKKYFIDGRKAREEFQPDQNGTLLLALRDFCAGDLVLLEKYRFLLEHTADGLCRAWDQDHFSLPTQDVWEERLTFPEKKDNFTYSLAMCVAGLRGAYFLLHRERWLQVAKEMEEVLLSQQGYFCRTVGQVTYGQVTEGNVIAEQMTDKELDASLLGLVWPAGIVGAKDVRMLKTVELLEQTFAQGFKVHRYAQDRYDGWVKNGVAQNKGAGYWPLLNFWMAGYWLEAGKKEKAKRYLDQVFLDLGKGKFIPEQIFANKEQVSVCPLAWSHAMLVLVEKKLIE